MATKATKTTDKAEASELRKAERYYRKGNALADKAIKSLLRDSTMIVHGGQALNAQLPDWLDRETMDWDIFSPGKSEKYAKQIETLLDKRYGGDYFSVEAAVHPGTFRVRNKVTQDVIADVTIPDRKIDFKTIGRINYATLKYHEDKIKETLDNPEATFRHRKDAETLQRIAIFKAARHKSRRENKKTSRSIDSVLGTSI